MSDPLIIDVKDSAATFERNVFCHDLSPGESRRPACSFGWNGPRPSETTAHLQSDQIQQHLQQNPGHQVSIADTRKKVMIVSIRPAVPVLSLTDLLKGSDPDPTEASSAL